MEASLTPIFRTSDEGAKDAVYLATKKGKQEESGTYWYKYAQHSPNALVNRPGALEEFMAKQEEYVRELIV